MSKVVSSKFSLQNLVSLFTLIIGTNYFLSYRWFDGILRICGIDNLAIITIEDLTFLFVENNISIIALTSLGFIGIFITDIGTSKRHKPIKSIKKDLKRFISYFLKGTWSKVIFIVLIIIIVLYAYIKVYKPILNFPNLTLLIVYVVILLIVPFLYYFLPKKRSLIFGFQIFLMFSWANLFINYILDELEENDYDKKTEISFNYKNKKVNTNDTLQFLIQSYKYTILRDSMDYYYFYDNSLIENFRYRNKSVKLEKE